MKLSQCRLLWRGPLSGTWYRAIQPRHWQTALATAHTTTIPGRFNAGNLSRPGFEVLYLAENHQVALFEVQALLGSPLPPALIVPNPASAWVIINVQVQLNRVADLTSSPQRRLIGTTVQELTGDWRGYLLRSPAPRLTAPDYTNVPTQKLGAALYNVRGLHGFLTYSAKVPTHRNLVVFPDKLRRGRDSIRFQNTATGQTHQMP